MTRILTWRDDQMRRSNWNLDCWFLWREENRRTRRKTLRAGMRTNNKLNPHMTPDLGIEPGSYWWEVSALPSAPSLHSLHFQTAIALSFSTVQHQVVLGWLTFLLPMSVEVSAVAWWWSVGILRTCPKNLHGSLSYLCLSNFWAYKVTLSVCELHSGFNPPMSSGSGSLQTWYYKPGITCQSLLWSHTILEKYSRFPLCGVSLRCHTYGSHCCLTAEWKILDIHAAVLLAASYSETLHQNKPNCCY